jgi:histone H3/H4
MAKKIIISEKTLRQGVEAQLLMEAGLSKADVERIVKDTLKDRQVDKDLEKRVKKIVADSVNMLFKTL